ncbi:MAG TPA: BON domain-containing protein [Gemmatimonadaceae bacterium]|nr:BON domain-containing protein [Gemmatimonadaceae bacterium]
MADDFDNTDEIANLSDDELLQHVRAELRAQNAFDSDDITVRVKDGVVTVAGRVGTEEELRIVDHVLTDVIGLAEIDNQLVIDELRRAISPEAIDEHLADEEEHSGLLLGDIARPYSPEAEHLADVSRDDESEGTHDIQESIENAEPWIPPESPTPEGIGGQGQGNFGIDSQR